MGQQVHQHTFPNGLTLLAERMDTVRSAAFNFLLPAGCIYDPGTREGCATLVADMVMRGAGERNSREVTLALDALGLDRDESVSLYHTRFWGATLADNLFPSLGIYADSVLRPHFPPEELDSAKALALQDIQGLDDEPRQKMMIELRRHHYPPPLGRDRRGTVESISALTLEQLKEHQKAIFQPRNAILSVAGNIEWQPLMEHVGRLFGEWTAGDERNVELGSPLGKRHHTEKDTTQTQIGIAYNTVTVADPEYYAAMGAVNILSGGMSARLFTEVREKRGLCYAVSAGYQTLKDRGSIICYAGTTTERAQETLDVTIGELKRLREGIEQDELDRVKAGLKSSLIMQEESTSARAGSMASDWFHLGRVRSFDEIHGAVEALSTDRIIAHLESHPPKDFTIATLGSKPLNTDGL